MKQKHSNVKKVTYLILLQHQAISDFAKWYAQMYKLDIGEIGR